MVCSRVGEHGRCRGSAGAGWRVFVHVPCRARGVRHVSAVLPGLPAACAPGGPGSRRLGGDCCPAEDVTQSMSHVTPVICIWRSVVPAPSDSRWRASPCSSASCHHETAYTCDVTTCKEPVPPHAPGRSAETCLRHKERHVCDLSRSFLCAALQAPTPGFVPLQRGDIFSSALDIMASQQSMFDDDGSSAQPSSQLDSLTSTLRAAADARAATPVRRFIRSAAKSRALIQLHFSAVACSVEVGKFGALLMHSCPIVKFEARHGRDHLQDCGTL